MNDLRKPVTGAIVVDLATARPIAPSPSRSLAPTSAPAPLAQQPADTSAMVAAYIGKQLFIELKSGTRITGKVISMTPECIILSTGIVATSSIAFMSETLLPSFGGR